MVSLLFNIVLIAICEIAIYFSYTNFFKIYQLNGYSLFKTFSILSIKNLTIIGFILLLFNLFFFITKEYYILTNIVLFLLLFVIFYNQKKHRKVGKNKLVFTKRFTRFFIVFLLNNLVYFTVFLFILKNNYFYFILINFLVSSFLIFIISHILIYPFELLIKKYYIKKAKNKLKKMPKLIVVGITGSYGKTSVKNYLYEFLKTKYKVCKTEKSFNTDMGFTKVILNDLKFDDEILILEYGADHNHDIKKLCKIVKPKYSIITGVTNQHLKTFKSIKNIINTKYELVENTEQNGEVVFNGDNQITREFYNITNIKKHMVSTLYESDFYASQIKIYSNKTEFLLKINNKNRVITTNLLGRHNVINIILALKMALILKIKPNDAILSIKKLKPVEHRLNLIENNGKFILDDSFNANTEGVYSALEVLNTFKNKKIVITCGIVELGENEYIENYKLGKELTKYDIVIITNQVNKKALLDGLKNSNNKVYAVDNLSIALTILKQNFNVGDVVLFLNDLPDNYK